MNLKTTVRFSILMPVFNQEKYVCTAIESVLTQDFTDFELIVIDDGSTDNSPAIIQTYGSKLKFLRQRNQGPEVARNNGAAIANGEYLVFLDSDDFFFPYALATIERVVRYFDFPPLVLATLSLFQNGEAIPAPVATPIEIYKYKDFLSRTRPLGSAERAANLTDSIVVRKTVFDEVGGMRNSSPQTFHNEDSHLLLKLGNYSPCIVINEPCTTAYRKHATSSSSNATAMADGWRRLARAERSGEYQGENRWGRYAVIGGRSLQCALRYCWRGGQRKLALQLIFETAPMIVVALSDKLLRRFRKTDPPIILA